MDDILSIINYPRFKDIIADQIRTAVENAEEGFDDHEADEDVISGDLGGQLRSRVRGRLGDIIWETRSHKLPGRGKGAPEKIFGADGVFEIKIYDVETDKLIISKGLPYQAKKNGSSQGLLDQVENLQKLSCSSVVIDYGPEGFEGIKEKDVLTAKGNLKNVSKENKKSLGDILAGDFLDCTVGRKGITYNKDARRIVDMSDRQNPKFLPLTANHLIQIVVGIDAYYLLQRERFRGVFRSRFKSFDPFE